MLFFYRRITENRSDVVTMWAAKDNKHGVPQPKRRKKEREPLLEWRRNKFQTLNILCLLDGRKYRNGDTHQSVSGRMAEAVITSVLQKKSNNGLKPCKPGFFSLPHCWSECKHLRPEYDNNLITPSTRFLWSCKRIQWHFIVISATNGVQWRLKEQQNNLFIVELPAVIKKANVSCCVIQTNATFPQYLFTSP